MGSRRVVMSLYMAVKYDNYAVAKLLLRHNAKVNTVSDKNLTPLHVAVINKSIKMVELLLNHGANVNPKRYGGKTPLYLAVENDSLEITRLLLEAGALLRKAYIKKSTIFDLVEKTVDGKMRSLLIDHAERQVGPVDRISSSLQGMKKGKRKMIKKLLRLSLLNKDKTLNETKKKRNISLRVKVLKRNAMRRVQNKGSSES